MKKSGIELDETELLVSKIVEGIQEKKGEKIVTLLYVKGVPIRMLVLSLIL